ncbi:hypothetical protein F4782DRAFT_503992 [Xylaria castorea]|nr:hypothetical protein F4782DRAFT_503992 [Xylaria castorea]
MAFPTTPKTTRAVAYNLTQSDTPEKTALRTLVKFRDDHNLQITNKALFEYTGVTHATGYRVLKSTNRRLCDETRGRPRALTEAHIDQIIEFIEREGWEARCLPWINLCDAAGLEFPTLSKPPSVPTIRKALYTRGWKKCVACSKYWTCEDVAQKRDCWAREQLEKHELDLSYYRKVRYSDEIHFKFSSEGKVNITRKAGTRYCAECIQYRTRPSDSGDRTVCLNAWACIGHDFKSKLVWYESSITLQAYLDQILKPQVQQWLDNGDTFILEEDGASGHGGQPENNIVKRWKEEVGLKHFFDCPGAPDLSPIENAWKAPKASTHSHAIWDEGALKKLAEEGWEALKQSTINEWCDSVPFKLLDVVKAEGQYTGH